MYNLLLQIMRTHMKTLMIWPTIHGDFKFFWLASNTICQPHLESRTFTTAYIQWGTDQQLPPDVLCNNIAMPKPSHDNLKWVYE